jgi:hypothetical protein
MEKPFGLEIAGVLSISLQKHLNTSRRQMIRKFRVHDALCQVQEMILHKKMDEKLKSDDFVID